MWVEVVVLVVDECDLFEAQLDLMLDFEDFDVCE